MTLVTISMSTSLDGYIVGPDGGFDWSVPDDELFDYATEEVAGLKVHLLGRALYETMSYWETNAERPDLTDRERRFADLWLGLPKVVFSTTLTEVSGSNTSLAAGSIEDEVERWKAEPGSGNIGVGGAGLARSVAALGLIDGYRTRVYPVLVGGGTPLFPRDEARVDLELESSRAFANGVVALVHRAVR